MAIPLDYTKPVMTHSRHKVHIYSVYQHYMNGAVYIEEDDLWVPCQWTLSGYYYPPLKYKYKTNELDLVNDDNI